MTFDSPLCLMVAAQGHFFGQSSRQSPEHDQILALPSAASERQVFIGVCDGGPKYR